jgi:hypothetical protein
MPFLQQEKAAKAEKNDHKNGILNHKNLRNQSWAASSKSFSKSHIDRTALCRPRVQVLVRRITESVYQLILPLIRIFLCNFARRRRRRNASSLYIMTSSLECTCPTPDGWMLVTVHLPGSAILLAK